LIPVLVRIQGVNMGTGIRFVGLPDIRVVPGAQIRLGNRVRIHSRARCHPRGVPHPTILGALRSGAKITIGDNSTMCGVSINCRAAITIGSWVQLGPGACLWDNDGQDLWNPNLRRLRNVQGVRMAPIVIEDDAFICPRAIILKGVTIGRGSVVGAGAVVTKDVPPGVIVAGNPARQVGIISLV
jgi:acetyltransferase-like isoleucine patch superfamily enzyme